MARDTEVAVLAYETDDGETFVFMWLPELIATAKNQVAQFAADKQIDFTWFDAINVYELMDRESLQ